MCSWFVTTYCTLIGFIHVLVQENERAVTIGKQPKEPKVTLDGEELEQVTGFVYLG